MAYLIDQLVWWLLLAAMFAALAGWAYGAMRAEAETQRLKRERERLMREFVALAGEAPDAPAPDLNVELMRQRTDVTESRARELEQAVEAMRARADAAEIRAAEAERALAAIELAAPEVQRLQLALDAAETDHRTALEVVATPIDDEAMQLQAWRLRYFEQRAAYLERQAQTAPALAAPEPVAAPVAVEADPIPLLHAEWRARFAEAAADELLIMAREPKTIAAPALTAEQLEAEQRRHWRMHYLERRAHHLQSAAAQTPAAQPMMAAPDQMLTEDDARRAWRQTYLEQRLAYLRGHATAMQAPEPTPEPAPPPEVVAEPQPLITRVEAERVEAPQAVAAPVADVEETTPPQSAPLVPQGMEQRPPSLPAARNGAPDDFTLIDGVSPMQQSTLNALGVYHFEQIAAWTPANIAWVDQYLRLRGRIVSEEWVEQAQDLAQGHGVARAERVSEDA